MENSISPVLDNSELRPAPHAIVESGLHGAWLLDIDGLLQHIFPRDTLPFDLEETFQHIKSTGKLYRDGRWTGFASTAKDAGGNSRIANLLNSVSLAIQEASGLTSEWQWSAVSACKNLPSARPSVEESGLVLLDKSMPAPEATWEDPRSIAEFRCKHTLDILSDAEQDLAEDARRVFSHQPNRRYVVGLTLCGSELQLCLFDRAGAMGELQFDIHSCPKRFLYTLGVLVFSDDTAIGYDPTIDLASDPRTIMVKGNTYEILDILHMDSVIKGRGTVCLRVTHGGENFIIKDCWADTSRPCTEAGLLKEAGDVPGLARWFEDEELHIEGESDTTDARRCILKDLDDYPRAQLYEELEIRIHHRIVIKDCGVSIQNFASRRELVGAFIDVISAHRTLHDEKNILHRDISLHNIMLLDNGSPPGKRPGLLIDLDYGVKVDHQDSSTQRSGTLPFMAVDILISGASIEHKAYHDLESFFYVLCWICTTMGGPGCQRGCGFKLENSELWHWFQYLGFDTVGVLKEYSLRYDEDFSALLSEFHPYFDALRPCAKDLRDLFLSQTIKKSPSSSAPIYDSILDILRRTRDILPEQEPRSVLEIRDPWPQIAARKGVVEEKVVEVPRRKKKKDVDTAALKAEMKRRREAENETGADDECGATKRAKLVHS